MPAEPIYVAARAILKPALRHGLRWTVDGAHLLPARGPVILAVNHSSYLDPVCTAFVADERGRRVRFLAKQELFEHRLLGPFLRAVHQIPVRRGTGDAATALDAAVAAVGRGECVVIFPEATISLDLEPMVPKTGVARLAQLTGVPVTPMGLWGAHRILFKGRKPNWKLGVAEVACVGSPVAVPPDVDVYEGADIVMEAVCEQVRRARAIYPQQPEPGADDWWVRASETAVLRSARAARNQQSDEAAS